MPMRSSMPEGTRVKLVRPVAPGRWPHHPPPFPDETLESWLLRLAMGVRRSVAGLVADYIGGAVADLRRSAGAVPPSWMSALSEGTGVSRERLTGFGYPQILNGLSFSRNGRRSGVELARTPAICPQCLRDSGVFHLRQSWWLPVALTCTHHDALLIKPPSGCFDDRCILVPVGAAPGERRHWIWSTAPQKPLPPLPVPQPATKDARLWQSLVDHAVAGGFVELGWARLPGTVFLAAVVGVEGVLRYGDASYRAFAAPGIKRHPRIIVPIPTETPEKRRERLLAVFARLRSWPEYASAHFGLTTPITRTDILAALGTRLSAAENRVPVSELARLPASFRDRLPEPVIPRAVCVRTRIEQLLRALVVDWPPGKRFGAWTLKRFDHRTMVAQVVEAALSGTLPPRTWQYEDLLGRAGWPRQDQPIAAARRKVGSSKRMSLPSTGRPMSRKRFMAKVKKAVQSRQTSRPLPAEPFQPSPAVLERAAAAIAMHHDELCLLHGAALRRRLAALAVELADGGATGGLP